MSKGKLIGIIVGVVCIIVVIIVVVTGIPRLDVDSDGETPQGNSEGKIAFLQTDGIHIIDPDGTGELKLTDTNESTWSTFVQSPDGSKIAYGDEGDLCIVNADGTGKTTVGSFEDEEPNPHCWLTNGKIVLNLGSSAYSPGLYGGGGSIYTVNSDGNDLTKLGDISPDAHSYALSLDGKKVAYIEDKVDESHTYYLWVMNTDGSAEKKLVEEDLYTTNLGYTQKGLTWSPDGKRITFLQGSGPSAALWLTDIDGTNRILLGYNAMIAGWSPDSENLAIYEYGSGLFIINLDNMNRTKASTYTDGLPVSWSPNGDRIVFFIDDGSLVVANTDGSGSTVIGYGYWPQWSPG